MNFREHLVECATAVSAITSVIGALIFWWQLHVMSGTLAVMQAEQRPWVKIRVSLGDSLDSRGGVAIPVKYVLENVGNVPALRVRVASWGFPDSPFSDEFFSFQRKKCAEFALVGRKPINLKPINLEQQWTIFPDDSRPWDDRQGAAIPGFSPDQLAAISSKDTNGKKSFTLTFAGCADYASPLDDKHHQTAFAYTLSQRMLFQGVDAQTTRFDFDSVVPADKIIMQERPSPPDLTN
jgi:hypothetical protein